MKTYKHLMDFFISDDNIRYSIYTASKNKLKRSEMRDFRIREDFWLKYFKEKSVNWKHINHTPIKIVDGSSGKERYIVVPTNKEQVFHHMIVNTMKPILCKGMYEHSYSAIPGRGPEAGKKTIDKWIRDDYKNCKYVLKLDIRHFFATIPHSVLKEKLRRVIKDEEFLKILYGVIDCYDSEEYVELPYDCKCADGNGIPLGFYTSQWISNWYLQDLDHYIKEQIKIPHYARYADDMVLFCKSKKYLHKVKNIIDWYLKFELGLRMKINWQIFRFDYIGEDGEHHGRDLDFMGYRFYCDRTTIRKKILYKSTKKANKLAKKLHVTSYDARQMLSRLGKFKHADAYEAFETYIKPKVNVKKLKLKISANDRCRNNLERNLRNELAKCSEYYSPGGDRHYLIENLQLRS